MAGPLMVQGMSARLAGRWEIAGRAFRAVTVLRERGNLEEALTTIKRAMALQKGDRVMEEVLDQIRKDQGSAVVQETVRRLTSRVKASHVFTHACRAVPPRPHWHAHR